MGYYKYNVDAGACIFMPMGTVQYPVIVQGN